MASVQGAECLGHIPLKKIYLFSRTFSRVPRLGGNERSFVPQAAGAALDRRARGCDYGFCVYVMGTVKGGEARGIQGGETGSWMRASQNMISDLSRKSFGVSASREQRYDGGGKPFFTPFLRSPQWGAGPVGLQARAGKLMAWRVGDSFGCSSL